MKIGVYLKIWNENRNRNGEKNPFHKNEVYNALFVCLFACFSSLLTIVAYKHCFTRGLQTLK